MEARGQGGIREMTPRQSLNAAGHAGRSDSEGHSARCNALFTEGGEGESGMFLYPCRAQDDGVRRMQNQLRFTDVLVPP